MQQLSRIYLNSKSDIKTNIDNLKPRYSTDRLKSNKYLVRTFNTQLFILLIIIYSHGQNSISNLDTNNITISNFFLPIRKKSLIFLRAPYKNKLARLNLLNLTYTQLISLRQPDLFTSVENKKILNNLITVTLLAGSYNFSTTKLKHAHTYVYTKLAYKNNFLIDKF